MWKNIRDEIGTVFELGNTNHKRYIQLRNAIWAGVRKELELTSSPVPATTNIIQADFQTMLFLEKVKEGDAWFYVYEIDGEIKAVILMQKEVGFLTQEAITFPLTAVLENRAGNLIFKLIDKTIELISERIEEGYEYFILSSAVGKTGKILAHNKRILEFFCKKFPKFVKNDGNLTIKAKKTHEIYGICVEFD
jgi:hypothetical protein